MLTRRKIRIGIALNSSIGAPSRADTLKRRIHAGLQADAFEIFLI
jgi:hypothetical protein